MRALHRPLLVRPQLRLKCVRLTYVRRVVCIDCTSPLLQQIEPQVVSAVNQLEAQRELSGSTTQAANQGKFDVEAAKGVASNTAATAVEQAKNLANSAYATAQVWGLHYRAYSRATHMSVVIIQQPSAGGFSDPEPRLDRAVDRANRSADGQGVPRLRADGCTTAHREGEDVRRRVNADWRRRNRDGAAG